MMDMMVFRVEQLVNFHSLLLLCIYAYSLNRVSPETMIKTVQTKVKDITDVNSQQ